MGDVDVIMWLVSGFVCIVLMGLNGCGKLMLLRMFVGELVLCLGICMMYVSIVYFD